MKPLDDDPNRIDVWCAFPGDITDTALLKTYRHLLTESERRQESRFHFSRDRQRYLVTRVLVRTVLSRYAPLAPTQWVFGTNAQGRPHIANAGTEHAISFNLAHAGNLIVLGVTQKRALGLDTENISVPKVELELADHFFAPTEAADLRAQDAADQQQRFFEYWTLKESYIKARGLGLSIPLDQFWFRFPDRRSIELTVHPDQHDLADRWHFSQGRVGTDYLVAVCAEYADRKAPRLVFRQVIPLQAESDLDYQPLRLSR